MQLVMSNPLHWKHIEITEAFFGISMMLEENRYNSNTSYFFDEKEATIMASQNSVISKEEVINLAKAWFKSYNSTFTDIYISESIQNLYDIRDDYNTRIFNFVDNELGPIDNYSGWLIFVDPCKIANWSHKCQYWFIVDNNKHYKKLDAEWPPNESINLEKIEIF